MYPNLTAMSNETPTVSTNGSAPPPQEISAEIEVPYAVHRWFASGEGWAYHPDIDLKQVRSWATRILANRSDVWQPTPDGEQVHEALEREQLSCDTGHNLCLVYRHYADKECPDPRAKQRFPTVLIVALAHDLNDAEIKEVQKQLSALHDKDLPQQPGRQDTLKLTVKRIAAPTANDQPVTPDNIPASLQPDAHPDVHRPAHRSFKLVILCAAVSVLLAVGVIIYLGPFPPEGNDWSQVKPTSSPPPEQGGNGGSSSNATSHFGVTPSPANTNTKSTDNQSPGSAARVKSQPEGAARWRKEAAEAMLRHLKRWHKSGPLIKELGRVSSLRQEARRLLEANLETVPTGGTIPMELENQIMSRFFLVLSQEPVRDLLSNDGVKNNTWQGKFMLLFREEHPYAKGDCPRWYPESEQELRQWLQELEQCFTNHSPGAPKDHIAGEPNIRSHEASDAISDLVDRVAGRIDYFAWKQAVESLGGKLKDCTDMRLKKWVENFRASTNGPSR
jgi:hypothetical protein